LTATPYPVRTMLRTYGRQVTTARRLARYRRLSRPVPTPEEDAEARQAREAKRQDRCCGRVAGPRSSRTAFVTGSDSPVVDDIKAALEDELGFRVTFAYPPEEQEMQILRQDTPDGPTAITGSERMPSSSASGNWPWKKSMKPCSKFRPPAADKVGNGTLRKGAPRWISRYSDSIRPTDRTGLGRSDAGEAAGTAARRRARTPRSRLPARTG